MAESNKSNTNTLLIIVLVIVLALVGYNLMTAPDTRTTGERIGDAVDELDDGVGDAADQLGDRTPTQRLGDEIEETGEEIQNNVDGR